MRYHNITHDDMKNGDGLRVVLWVAGCKHHCQGCQNPVTWNPDDGLPFNVTALEELFADLYRGYVSGVTLSGGDPLHEANRGEIYKLAREVKTRFPNKSVWLYTGYTWEEICADKDLLSIMKFVDVLVDGPYVEALRDVNYPWAGSTNQRVIDVRKTLREGRIILYESY